DPSQTAVQSVGGISFTAHYNGSTTYNESTSSCEQLSPVKLDSSSPTTTHNKTNHVITSSAIGSTVNDSATVTGTQAGGTPTGTVTFTLYSSSDCSAGGVARTSVATRRSSDLDPSQTAVQSVGGISFTAHYNGSTTYNESTSSCEQLSPVKLDS